MPLLLALIFVIVRLCISEYRKEKAAAYSREYRKNNPNPHLQGFDPEKWKKFNDAMNGRR